MTAAPSSSSFFALRPLGRIQRVLLLARCCGHREQGRGLRDRARGDHVERSRHALGLGGVHLTRSSPSSATHASRNSARSLRGSINAIGAPVAIAMTKPGSPAPLPTSTQCARQGQARSAARESAMWRSMNSTVDCATRGSDARFSSSTIATKRASFSSVSRETGGSTPADGRHAAAAARKWSADSAAGVMPAIRDASSRLAVGPA